MDRHQTILPKLNALRRDVLSSELGAGVPPRLQLWRWLFVPWRELIWPYGRIWASLAAVWVVALAVNLSLGDRSQAAAPKSSRPSPEMVLAFWRQKQSLAELIEPRPPRLAAPPKSTLPGPRSQRRTESLSA